VPGLKLRIGGSCGRGDEPLVRQLRARLEAAGCLADAEFRPNLDRAAKLEFLRSLTVFSVPALYGEAFGLYVIEAMAAGVPVVLPRTAAFPEIIEATGGGVLYDPGAPAGCRLTVDEPNERGEMNLSDAVGQVAPDGEFESRKPVWKPALQPRREEASALAAAIEALLLDPQKAESYGAAGQQAVFERFSAETMAQATLESFKALQPERRL
jgi:glycosyltransferase involved in cell wall biosynthesis